MKTDQLALNLAADLGMADQDLWLTELLMRSDTPTAFVDAIRLHTDLDEDGLHRVYSLYLTWGVGDALQGFDDEVDRQLESVSFSPVALEIQRIEYEINITIPNLRYARS